MPETQTPEQRAEARALKRLKSEGYAKMPSPEVLARATALETVRINAIDKTDTTTIQRANLSANILAQHVEVQKEKLEPKVPGYDEMVTQAVAFATALLKQGQEIMAQRGHEFDVADDEAVDDEDLGGDEN